MSGVIGPCALALYALNYSKIPFITALVGLFGYNLSEQLPVSFCPTLSVWNVSVIMHVTLIQLVHATCCHVSAMPCVVLQEPHFRLVAVASCLFAVLSSTDVNFGHYPAYSNMVTKEQPGQTGVLRTFQPSDAPLAVIDCGRNSPLPVIVFVKVLHLLLEASITLREHMHGKIYKMDVFPGCHAGLMKTTQDILYDMLH